MKFYPVEGNSQRLDGGALFGHVPRVLWEKWFPTDEFNRISLATRALLVQLDDGRNVLFEAGIGAFFEPKLKQRFGVIEEEHILLKNLQALGLRESDIDIVVLSHLHFDHAGGVLSAYGDGEPRLLFPKAKFYVGREHRERALHPHTRDRASFVSLIHEKLDQSGRLLLIDQPFHPDLDFGVRFHVSHGHTPGLLLAELDHQGSPVVFVSDLIPGVPWMHLPITMGYDRYPELLVDEKAKLLASLLQRQGEVFFTHDPNVRFAKVKQDGKGVYTAEPVTSTSGTLLHKRRVDE